MKKIVTVIGARPQFIKMALISNALRTRGVKEIIIHTGQHYDRNMSEVFFEELDIKKPDYNLGVGSCPHGEQTAKMLMGIEKLLMRLSPEIVLVYGDTNSTLAGALAAAKLGIRVAHVEAGLRSWNINMPEEINRVATDSISSVLFCPTKASADNLKSEGRRSGVYLVGDVMYDLLKLWSKRIIIPENPGDYILCTVHRQENTDCKGSLKGIFEAMGLIKKRIIMPLHPRTGKFIKKYKIKAAGNIKIIKPVGYPEMLNLEKHASLIITDSGGVQKEAFIFNVPCVTLREETEWVETVANKMNVLAGTSPKKILSAIKRLNGCYKKIRPEKFYSDGFAHKRIAEILNRALKGKINAAPYKL